MERREIEGQLIGAWLMGVNLGYVDMLTDSDFKVYHNEFRAIAKLHRADKLDFISITRESHRSPTELSEIMGYYLPSAFESAYRQLKAEQIRRKLMVVCESPGNLELDIRQILSDLDDLNRDFLDEMPPHGLLAEYATELDRRARTKPLFYGMPALDGITGGLRSQELIIVAARPSNGKTAISLGGAYNLALSGKKVCFFSLEMSRHQLVERLVLRLSDINYKHLQRPENLTDAEWDMLPRVELPNGLLIYEKTRTLSGIRRVVKNEKPDAVFIDQLSLIRPEIKFRDKRDQFTYCVESLKTLSMELELPVILLAQINRQGGEKMPNLNHLKESGALEECADVVIMLHRLTEDECNQTKAFRGQYQAIAESGRIPISLSVEKNRNGATGVLPYVFIPGRLRFEEVVEKWTE